VSHPIEQKLALLRRSVRRLVLVHGLSWMVGTALTAVILLGIVDYFVRFEDRGLRFFATSLVFAALGWTAYRWLYRGLSTQLSDVDLAQRIQNRFPALGDSLASAVEFLHQPEEDPKAGSVALRQAVIAKTAAETERLDFLGVLQTRSIRRALFASAAVVLAALGLFAADPGSSRIALARLINPLADKGWPQVTHLAVVQAKDRVARGQSFHIEVSDKNGARLPSSVRFLCRWENADGSVTPETEPMQFVRDVMVIRRENIQRPFSYRVEGGDDRSMPWRRVEVVEPPAIASLAIRLIPPAYTGWPPRSGERNIRAMVGTRVEISGMATKPLAAASLSLDGGQEIAAVLGEDGRSFTIGANGQSPFVVEKSGFYRLQLMDPELDPEDSLAAGDRYEITAIADNPPSVLIEQPSADIFVTPQATVPFSILVKDDLAIRQIDLEYARSGSGEPVAPGPQTALPAGPPSQPPTADSPRSNPVPPRPAVIPLYVGPSRANPPPESAAAGNGAGETRQVHYDWSLTELGLHPGTVLICRGVATDYHPHSTRSEPRRLSIITPEELADRLAVRQAALLAELTRVLELQRKCREEVRTIEIQAREMGRLGQPDMDRLRGAELTQGQVVQSLTSRTDGVPMHVTGLLADLTHNKIDSPDVQRRMQAVLTQIGRLADNELAIIARGLTAAIKSGQVQLDEGALARVGKPNAAVADPLAVAGGNQEQVIQSLEQMLAELGRWDSFRRFHRDVGQLLRDQQELNQWTAALGRRTLTRDLKDLPPQDLADLRVAAVKQLDVSLRLDRILQSMEQAAGPLRESDPLAAQAVADAFQRARELSISGAGRQAAGHLDRNRMGEAIALQGQILENLREILDILANRREHELSRLVKKLQEAEQEIADLGGQQGGLHKQMQQAAGMPEAAKADAEQKRRELQRLGARQEQLQKKTEAMARRLERLTAQQAAKSASQAAEKMGQAGQCCSVGECAKACEQAWQAQRLLEKSREQLGQERRQAESQLATEQLSRLDDALKGLQRRQQAALEETRRIDGFRQSKTPLGEAREASLTELAREQKLLHAETAALAEKLAGSEIFHMALSAAVREMAAAAGLLDRLRTDEPTQNAQRSALGRLALLLESLKPEPAAKKPGEPPAGGAGGKGGQPQGGGDTAQNLAELKLLKLMQQDVRARTRALDESVRQGQRPADQAQREYAQLSEEQGRLAELLMALIPPQEEPPAEK
jgi:hypothetical protein